MATYQVQTEGGTYEVHTEEPKSLPIQSNMETPGGFPEPQASDNPEAGAEKPVEQKLAENAVEAGNGIGMAQGVAGLGQAGMNLAAKIPSVEGGAGVLNTMGQYAKRFGQNQAMKALGATGGQIGQAGIPESREIAQAVIDKGIVSPLRGPIGLEEKVNQLHDVAGKGVGMARQYGDTVGQAPQMPEILQQVKQNLEGKYASGMDKGMSGLNRAREEIAKGGTGSFVGNAQKATDLNTAASKNAMYRPTGAGTDTADVISHMNNQALEKVLTPEQMARYNLDKNDYGTLQKVKGFLERGERREMSGRGGAATVGKAIADHTMDMVGNRVAAVGGSKLGDVLNTAGKFEKPATKTLAAYLSELNDKDK